LGCGQVPSENDSVVINGTVNVVDKTITELTVSSRAILQNHPNSWMRLTVNGDVINNGTVQNNPSKPNLKMVVSGNIINNGIWNNASTSIIGTQARTITGNPIQSSELRLASNLSINSASIALSNKVHFDKELTLTFPNSNEITFSGEVYFSSKVTFPNSAKITFLGKASRVGNIMGENLTLIYGGSETQEINNSTHNASHVIFAGNGEKIITDMTLNASLTINEGVTVQNHPNSWMRLTVNGDVINNGTVQNNPSKPDLKMVVSGNIINNGIWNNASTSIIGTQARTITGNPIQSSELRLASNLSINSASIALSNKVHFDKELTLTFPNSNEITFSGEVYFSSKVTFPNSAKITFLGKASRVGNIMGENLTLIYGGSETQEINNSTHNASHVIFAGNGEKIITDMTLNASLTINEGVTVQNHPNSWMRLTVNGNVINNGTIQDNPDGSYLKMVVSGNIINNNIWNNSSTTLTFPSGEFRMTGTPTWEEPKRTSSYEITDYLNTRHHWQVSVDGVLSEQRGINDPSLVALPVVAVPEPTLPEPNTGATISSVIKPKVYITTNSYLYSKESPYISVYVSTDVEGADMTEELYDIYVAVGGPNGLALFDSGQGISGLTTETIPYLANVTVMQSDWVETFNYEFTEYASAGDYFVHIGVLSKDGRIISEDSVDFVYDPDYLDPFLAMETSTRSSYDRTNRAGIDGINYIKPNASLSDALKVYYPELEQKLKIYDVFSLVKDGLDLLEEAGGIISEYVNDGKDCDLDETQRDFLLVARTMEYILNNYSIYKGANIRFAGALKEIYKAQNQRLIAYQSVLAGSVFLKFKHVTRFFRIDSAGQRTLKVEVKPIFHFPYQCSVNCEKTYYRQMSEARKRGYTFEVQSKKKERGDNRHELTNVIPGAYTITATDTTNGRVYRTNRVFKKLGETVTITFDYDGNYEKISTQPTGIECF
jgi:hypothetical protein